MPPIQSLRGTAQPLDEVTARLQLGRLAIVQDLPNERPHLLNRIEVGAIFRMPLDDMKPMSAQATQRLLGPEAPLVVHDQGHCRRQTTAKASPKPTEAVPRNHTPEPVPIHMSRVVAFGTCRKDV